MGTGAPAGTCGPTLLGCKSLKVSCRFLPFDRNIAATFSNETLPRFGSVSCCASCASLRCAVAVFAGGALSSSSQGTSVGGSGGRGLRSPTAAGRPGSPSTANIVSGAGSAGIMAPALGAPAVWNCIQGFGGGGFFGPIGFGFGGIAKAVGGSSTPGGLLATGRGACSGGT